MKFNKRTSIEMNPLALLIFLAGMSSLSADPVSPAPVAKLSEEEIKEVVKNAEEVVEEVAKQAAEKKVEGAQPADVPEEQGDVIFVPELDRIGELQDSGLLPGMDENASMIDPADQALLEAEIDSLSQQNIQKPTKKTVLTFVKDSATWEYHPANLLGIKIIRDKRSKLKIDSEYIVRIPDKDQLGVEFYGLPYMPESDALKEVLKGYLDKPLTYGGLEDIIKKIQSHYIANGHPLIHVYVPVQQVAQSVEIAVLEGAITQVKIEEEKDDGEKTFSSRWKGWYKNAYNIEDIAEKVTQRSQVLPFMQPKDAVAILDESAVNPWVRLNRKQSHPFLRTSGVLSPAKEGEDFLLGETLLTIRHEQSRPLKFFAGYDNTLTEAIGEDRFYFGSIWYDAFNLKQDHQFATQFFLSRDPDSFYGFSSSYLIPWKEPFFFADSYGDKHFTELYASYVSTQSGVSAAGIETNFGGDSIVLGGIHYMSLPDIVEGGKRIARSANSQISDDQFKFYSKEKKSRQEFGVYHEVGAGLELKSSNSSLEFGGTTVSDDDTLISHLMAAYNVRQTDKMGESNFTWRNYIGLGGSSEEEMERLRAGAEPNYYYTSLSLSREQDLIHGAYVTATLKGQYSTANLLSSEQFGLGGTNSIPGYAERAYRADIGFSASLEVVSPPMHPLLKLKGSSGWVDELRVVAFIDYGYGKTVDEQVASDISQTLYSVGSGIRYKFDDNFTFRMDYGFPLRDLDSPEFDEEASDARMHLGAVWTF